MFSGIYKLISGMTSQTHRQEEVARNLAGNGLAGFKALKQSPASFENLLEKGVDAAGASDFNSLYTDYSQGALKPTDRSLDFAISGDGFFAVQVAPNQLQYTRNGSFNLSADGSLTTMEGYPVQSQGGALRLQPTDRLDTLRTKGDGTLLVSDSTGIEREAGRLAILMPKDVTQLQRLSANYYTAPIGVKMAPTTKGELHGHTLEVANFSAVQEMSNMIASLREFEMAQKLVGMQMDLAREEQQKLTA